MGDLSVSLNSGNPWLYTRYRSRWAAADNISVTSEAACTKCKEGCKACSAHPFCTNWCTCTGTAFWDSHLLRLAVFGIIPLIVCTAFRVLRSRLVVEWIINHKLTSYAEKTDVAIAALVERIVSFFVVHFFTVIAFLYTIFQLSMRGEVRENFTPGRKKKPDTCPKVCGQLMIQVYTSSCTVSRQHFAHSFVLASCFMGSIIHAFLRTGYAVLSAPSSYLLVTALNETSNDDNVNLNQIEAYCKSHGGGTSSSPTTDVYHICNLWRLHFALCLCTAIYNLVVAIVIIPLLYRVIILTNMVTRGFRTHRVVGPMGDFRVNARENDDGEVVPLTRSEWATLAKQNDDEASCCKFFWNHIGAFIAALCMMSRQFIFDIASYDEFRGYTFFFSDEAVSITITFFGIMSIVVLCGDAMLSICFSPYEIDDYYAHDGYYAHTQAAYPWLTILFIVLGFVVAAIACSASNFGYYPDWKDEKAGAPPDDTDVYVETIWTDVWGGLFYLIADAFLLLVVFLGLPVLACFQLKLDRYQLCCSCCRSEFKMEEVCTTNFWKSVTVSLIGVAVTIFAIADVSWHISPQNDHKHCKERTSEFTTGDCVKEKLDIADDVMETVSAFLLAIYHVSGSVGEGNRGIYALDKNTMSGLLLFIGTVWIAAVMEELSHIKRASLRFALG